MNYKMTFFKFFFIFTSFLGLFSASLRALEVWDKFQYNVRSVVFHPKVRRALHPSDIGIEARYAYFRPESKKQRHVFRNGWADYQLEISKGFGCNWRAWFGVNGLSKEGRNRCFDEKTRIRLIPINFGLKYFFPLRCKTNFYIGAGASYGYLKVKNHSDFFPRHRHRSHWGAVIQTGLTYSFWKRAWVSVFADYFYQRFNFSNIHASSRHDASYFFDSGTIEGSTLNMSGFKFGVSIGILLY